MTGPIPYSPTPGLSYDPSDNVYWDPQGLADEIDRTFEICQGCRMCFKSIKILRFKGIKI